MVSSRPKSGKLLSFSGTWLPTWRSAAARGCTMAAFLLLSSAVYADPIRLVTSGQVSASEGVNGFVLVGAGFHVSGEFPFGGPIESCFPCTPGTLISLSGSAPPDTYGDPSVVDGVVYEGFPFFNGGPIFTGLFSFTSGFVAVPDMTGELYAERSQPFTFTGSLVAYDNIQRTGTPLFSLNLIGSGTATLSFSHQDFGLTTDRITYDFTAAAATPEPATLLLVAPALAWMARRRRVTDRAASH